VSALGISLYSGFIGAAVRPDHARLLTETAVEHGASRFTPPAYCARGVLGAERDFVARARIAGQGTDDRRDRVDDLDDRNRSGLRPQSVYIRKT
jgi:hypothetical protein